MLRVENIFFGYKKSRILDDISFQISEGENLAVIGESGSGKSTLLKLLYGTYDLNEGQIFWKDKEILGPKFNLITGPEFMKYVAQEFDLMPFITVSENIGAFLSNFYPEEKKERIEELLEVVELSEYSEIKVKELSGGQKQRVALARAIAKEPEILLLDEPFSHIDNFKKNSLRRSLFKYLKKQNITCIVATHDKDDVLPFSDRIIVLHEKKILVNDSPQNIYNNPKGKLVASFFEEYNLIDGRIVYASQLEIVDQSDITVIVECSYYKGSHYLIQSSFHGETIFFTHNEALEKGQKFFVEVCN